MERNRYTYAGMALVLIVLGLASRKFAGILPEWNQLYLGDVLWASMVFFLTGMVFNRKSLGWVSTGALLFSYGIEFSQLYHAPWIENIRDTRMGSLVLGHGFLWSDLVCYTIGIMIGVLVEKFFLKKMNTR